MRKSQTLSPALGLEKHPNVYWKTARSTGSPVRLRHLHSRLAQLVRACENTESSRLKAESIKVKNQSYYLSKVKTETQKLFQILSKVLKGCDSMASRFVSGCMAG